MVTFRRNITTRLLPIRKEMIASMAETTAQANITLKFEEGSRQRHSCTHSHKEIATSETLEEEGEKNSVSYNQPDVLDRTDLITQLDRAIKVYRELYDQYTPNV